MHGAQLLIVVSDPAHAFDQANYKLFTADPDAEVQGIPVLRVRRSDIAPLLQAWQLDAVAAMIDRDLQPRSRLLAGVTVDYREFLARNRRTVRNVIAVLPGSDPSRRDETVVIGAHYDHVGLGGRLSVSPERAGEIHNGADDNASGTSALIEMARAAAADPSRFPRSVVFAAFAGEERGLLGSAYYAGHPTIPLKDTVAMLNLDMIGRSRGKVQTSGLEKAPSLEPDMKAAARAAGGIEVGREGPGAGRSDDASFLQRRIPSIIFFTGFHTDYHRPGDDWEKIDAPGTARVATVALELAARIAARPDRPVFVD
jgi:Zn-dependent M28 family amino/carboxypeptidase